MATDRRDTRTRWEGIFARHQRGCPVEKLPPKSTLSQIKRACRCAPSHYGRAYDRVERRHRRTKVFTTPAEARQARRDLLALIEKGGVSKEAPLRLREAHPRFVADAKAGRALNKKGKKYKPNAIKNIDEVLRVHVVPSLGPRRLADIRKRDIQKIVDDLNQRLSGSRIRAVVNAVRSLYTWAKQRELASHDPADDIILPAMNAEPRERVATPQELAELLSVLELKDRLPYALGGYAWGRRAQIQHVLWEEVDLKVGLIEWGADEQGASTHAALAHSRRGLAGSSVKAIVSWWPGSAAMPKTGFAGSSFAGDLGNGWNVRTSCILRSPRIQVNGRSCGISLRLKSASSR